MGVEEVSQLTGSAVAIGVLVWMVKYFIGVLEKKDQQIIQQTKEFVHATNNFDKSYRENTEAVRSLENTIREKLD